MEYPNYPELAKISKDDEFYPQFKIIQIDLNNYYLDNNGSFIHLINDNGVWKVAGTDKRYDIEFIDQTDKSQKYGNILYDIFPTKKPSKPLNLSDLTKTKNTVKLTNVERIIKHDRELNDILVNEYELPSKNTNQTWKEYYFMLTNLPNMEEYNLISEIISNDSTFDQEFDDLIDLILKQNPKNLVLKEIDLERKYPLINNLRDFYIRYAMLSAKDDKSQKTNKLKFIIKWLDSFLNDMILID